MGLMEWLSLGTAAVTGIVAAASTVAFMRGRLVSLLERLDTIEQRMETRCKEAEERSEARYKEARESIREAHRRIDALKYGLSRGNGAE